jgi:hypothetical protein
MSIERRFTRGAECRAKGDDAKPGLEGYAAVFGQEYVLYEDSGMRWVETIKQGAFARVLKENQDVRCLFNHDPNKVLARSENGTLLMSEDKKGLSYDATLDSRTHVAQDVRCFVDRKDVTGCSFSFRVSKQAWREEESSDGKMTIYTREIEEIGDLYDVGPVTFPAYEGTSVGARTAAALARELRSIPGMAPELRSRMLARAKKDSECDCRCVACARDSDCAKCSDHMVDCGDESNCGHGRSARGQADANGDSMGCECKCRSCSDGNCKGCPDDLAACGDEENCRCQRSATLSQEQAAARAHALKLSL